MYLNNLEIMMLIEIHCFVQTKDMRTQNGSPAAGRAIAKLVEYELVEIDKRCPPPGLDAGLYATTDRGTAHIEQLNNAPLPVQRWVCNNTLGACNAD